MAIEEARELMKKWKRLDYRYGRSPRRSQKLWWWKELEEIEKHGENSRQSASENLIFDTFYFANF